MRVGRAEVLAMAELARLRLAEDEVDRFAAELSAILEHMRTLEEVDIAGIPPMGAPVEGAAPLRGEDRSADPLRRPLADMATGWEQGFFTLPRLPALDPRELDDSP